MHVRARPSAVVLYGALLVHTLVSAGNYLFAKRALMEIPALPLGLLRFAGAAVLLLILLRRVRPPGQRLPPRGEWKKLLFLSFIGVPVNQGFFLFGLQLSTAAHAALLYTLTPLFVLLLAQALIGESPGRRTTAGTALALGGTIYVLLQRGVGASREPLAGDLLLLVAVVAWAVYTWEGLARFRPSPGRSSRGRSCIFPSAWARSWSPPTGRTSPMPRGRRGGASRI